MGIDPNRNWGFSHKVSSAEDISEDANGDSLPFTQDESKLLDNIVKVIYL